MAPDKPNLDLDPVFMEAVECLPDGLTIFDRDGLPILSNQASARRFPHLYQAFIDGAPSYTDALRRSIELSRPDFTAEQVEEWTITIGRYAESGETYEQATHDGRIVQVTYRPMSDGRKVAISVDVTELRQREKELKRAKRAAEAANISKSAFLANMSHEIRTPLNGIMGMAQVLEGVGLSAEHREYVSTILEAGRNLMALLNDVLDLSKIEAGKFDIVPADASLHHLLQRQLKLWRPRAEEKGLELSLAFDSELPAYLSFDAVRVQQCISNLVSNAIKFTAKGCVDIFAGARKQDDGGYLVEVRVTDTGPGMDAETLERLFKPFTQADETIQRAHGGSGLGLSITRHLAELMGGGAGATSEPGRGSTFRVSFHAALASSQPQAGIAVRPEAGDIRESLKQSNLRVLVVDDHPINRQVVSLFLRPFNIRVVEAVNGVEALAALEKEAFDVVLLDMHMPVMDGPTTIQHIRASERPWKDVPVVALTADAMSGDRERYLGMGMNGYLSKPLAERDLLSEIARVRSADRPDATLAKAS
ncbi:MAG: response regulator [Hyphomonadaceae bacterium]|nr:response regulator [Hyphomonadaceae bacterium]